MRSNKIYCEQYHKFVYKIKTLTEREKKRICHNKAISGSVKFNWRKNF